MFLITHQVAKIFTNLIEHLKLVEVLWFPPQVRQPGLYHQTTCDLVTHVYYAKFRTESIEILRTNNAGQTDGRDDQIL